MHLTHTFVTAHDLELFRRWLVPLAPAELARTSPETRRELLRGAIDGLGIDLATWKWFGDALAAEGDAFLRQVRFVMYFYPSAFLNQRSQGSSKLQRGSFGLHASLLEQATGSRRLVPSSSDPEAVEYSSTHFHRFSWLTPEDLSALQIVRPLAALRAHAHESADARAYPPAQVPAYVERCIEDSAALIELARSRRSERLALVAMLDNTDWEYE
ncbi:MAG: hypothetical protein U0263_11995 [Polyangiaceae bacterium]